ncbi:protein CIP2A homolog L-like [Branchiostoma lanceolatum]|uniref:protein CIP2A homolog L-like n=1 Tax=Branchiostoma lanceolatum TaxID=7740 RepID=UPI00345117D7
MDDGVQDFINQLHSDPTDGSAENEVMEDGWFTRARDFLSCSRLVNVVKTTVVMAALITSLTLILLHISTPHPDFDVLGEQSALTSRLKSQLSILEERLENRSALIYRLGGHIMTLEERLENRSALIYNLEGHLMTLEERLENRSALVSRLEGQLSSHEASRAQLAAMLSRLEVQVSTLEERIEIRSALVSRLKDQVSSLEAKTKFGNVREVETNSRTKTFLIDLTG